MFSTLILSTQDTVNLLRIWFWKKNKLDQKLIKSVNSKTKPIFRLLNWSKVLKSNQTFCCIVRTKKSTHMILSSKCRNKRLQYCDWWTELFWSTIKSDIRRYGNIQKIAVDQGDDYTTGCLLVYLYFKEHCRRVTINLSKQQFCDTDPKVIQQYPILELAQPL